MNETDGVSVTFCPLFFLVFSFSLLVLVSRRAMLRTTGEVRGALSTRTVLYSTFFGFSLSTPFDRISSSRKRMSRRWRVAEEDDIVTFRPCGMSLDI